MNISRRHLLINAAVGPTAAATLFQRHAFGTETFVELVDEDTRGELGQRDLSESGLDTREAKKEFLFPKDANDHIPYGIDVSHHIQDIPWEDLQGSKCEFVYVKATQATRGVDGWFERHWKSAYEISRIPVGGYHFLCPHRSGRSQAEFFLSKLLKVGGLNKGHLQPVLDLEWDTFGPDFKRIQVGKDKNGRPIYKDHWTDVPSEEIVASAQEFIDTIKKASKNDIVPLVYTNRTWWLSRVGENAHLAGCKIWISDYRKKSFEDQMPLKVGNHEHSLWQFTESGYIEIGGKRFGPIDCNKLMAQTVDDLVIE